jgi:hypothetical protein
MVTIIDREESDQALLGEIRSGDFRGVWLSCNIFIDDETQVSVNDSVASGWSLVLSATIFCVASYVCFWHKADIATVFGDVRFRE